ncbi:MAG TPA: DUF3616 domain-containing protein [Vicinamibacterales bacterium]|nr:DUF3616 domain-containing protein [Vicinamibacterales bacterium]
MTQTTKHVYRGTCDASAAVRLGATNLFATASDEDFVLRVYDRALPGDPIATRDLKAFLKPVNPKKEPDIEGAAQLGDVVYWVGSHSRDKDGVVQESRHRLFATTVTTTGGVADIEPRGEPYTQLLADLVSSPDLAGLGLREASERPPEAVGGLNIEGLAPTPAGQLLIGFRNPIPNRQTLIVRLENPSELVAQPSRPARLAPPLLLDLGGRGIRALEFVPDVRAYVIVAGAFDDRSDFAVYRWSGAAADKPVLLDIPGVHEMRPEELIVIPRTDGTFEIELFSDDGDVLVGEVRCKKLKDPQSQTFGSIRVRTPFI